MTEKQTDPKPEEIKEPENTEKGLNDLLDGQGQSANNLNSPEPKPEGKEKEEKAPENKEETPEEKEKPEVEAETINNEGEKKVFWDKFNSEEDAREAYGNAERKISEQGEIISKLEKESEEVQGFFTNLNKALESNPELLENLKVAIKKAMEPENPGSEPGEKDQPNIDELIEKKIKEREDEKAELDEINKWIDDHPDISENDHELGKKMIEYIEENNLPSNLKTLELVYNFLNGDKVAEKKVDQIIKTKEIKEKERENAAGVGDGKGGGSGKAPTKKSGFDELVGGGKNVNRF